MTTDECFCSHDLNVLKKKDSPTTTFLLRQGQPVNQLNLSVKTRPSYPPLFLISYLPAPKNPACPEFLEGICPSRIFPSQSKTIPIGTFTYPKIGKTTYSMSKIHDLKLNKLSILSNSLL